MSRDDSARKFELHFFIDLELKATLFRCGLDDPERIFLATWGVNPERLGRLTYGRQQQGEGECKSVCLSVIHVFGCQYFGNGYHVS